MEGDVMLSGAGLPALLAVGGALLGGVFALLKWFAGRLLADIEDKLSRIDEIDQRVSSRVDGLETRIERVLAELPVHYQRRDDAIREYTTLNAKMDRLYEVIMEIHHHGR